MPRGALFIAVSLVAGALAGCNIVTPAFLLVHGPPRVEKVHTLNPDRPTVLFLDDPGNRLPRRQLRPVILETTEGVLLARRVVHSDSKSNNLISSASVMAMTDQESAGERRSIAEVGRAVGADVVVWVTVDSFALSPDGQTLQPSARVRTRVVDAAADAVIWPPEREGFPLTVTLPTASAALPSTQEEARKMQTALAEYTGRAIAEQFFTIERPQSARAGER